MKIFATTLASETNTSAIVPTGRIDFEVQGVFRGDGGTKAASGIGVFHAELQRLARADGHQVVESIAAYAQPSGPTLRSVYEDFRRKILSDLEMSLPELGIASCRDRMCQSV